MTEDPTRSRPLPDGPPRLPRRRNRGPVALLAAGVLLLGGVVATHEPPTPEAAPLSAAAAERARRELLDQATVTRDQDRQDTVGTMLGRRAKALLSHDKAAFLATVDPEATAFRAAQAKWFDNLSSVPFSTWTLELGDRGVLRLSQARAGALGSAAFVAPVDVSYEIAGYDHSAQHYDEMLTFVPRAGRWYVNADDDARPPQGHRELWDVGRVQVVKGEHVLVLGLGTTRELEAYAREVDRAVPRVDSAWGHEWAGQVLLVVTRTEDEMASLLGGRPSSYRQLAAVTRGELGAEEGTAAADRVLVNPKAYADLSPMGRRVILGHEITHVAARARTQPWTPKWLAEGLADYVGYLKSGLPDDVIAQELTDDVRKGKVPSDLPSNSDFGTTNPDLPQTYEMSWLACKMIVERYGGREALVEFYRTIGARGGDGGVVDRAFRDVLGTTPAAFTREWRSYVRHQLA
jgi:hypothetical protein